MDNKEYRSLSGKTIAMTGCTGGLGRELCFKLVSLGGALIMLDRNQNKASDLERELTEAYRGAKITRIKTELEDMESVKHTLNTLIQLKPDIFIHNAGTYSIPRHICKSGYDNVFQINFASPYYIIRSLKESLPSLKAVAVGSIAHTYSDIDEDDIDFRGRSSSAKAYGNSKRLLMLSLHELFKNDEGRLSVVHPGITFTNITAHYPKVIFAIIKYPMKIIFMKPKKASLCLLEGVFGNTPFGYWIGPRFFDIWGKPKIKKLKACFGQDSKKALEAADDVFNNLKTAKWC